MMTTNDFIIRDKLAEILCVYCGDCGVTLAEGWHYVNVVDNVIGHLRANQKINAIMAVRTATEFNNCEARSQFNNAKLVSAINNTAGCTYIDGVFKIHNRLGLKNAKDFVDLVASTGIHERI